MNNIKTYIDRYKTIALNLGYTGKSAEILIQLLAQASYINEVENATYLAESSFEKCSLMNSKIQHCMDHMYSVYRGTCPRVVMKIKPTKYFSLKPFDPLIESSNFTVHYLGYYQVTDLEGGVVNMAELISKLLSGSDSSGNSSSTLDTVRYSTLLKQIDVTCGSNIEGSNIKDGSDLDEGAINPTTLTLEDLVALDPSYYKGTWNYSDLILSPNFDETDSDVQIVIGLIAPKRRDSMVIEKKIDQTNTYYLDCTADNLSNDMYVKINGEVVERTRLFSEHILDHKIFDLTLPSYGSRLYVANYFKDTIGRNENDLAQFSGDDGMTENTEIYAKYFGFSSLSDYSESELSRLNLKGVVFKKFNPSFLVSMGYSEQNTGLCYIKEVEREDSTSIHYRASRERYVSSILRSNSDIGTVLEESFPTIIEPGGTTYQYTLSGEFNRYSNVNIFYIPKNEGLYLDSESISEFKTNKRAYYAVTDIVSINPGRRYTVNIDVDLELYRMSSDNLNNIVGEDILKSRYEKKFGIKFDEKEISELQSLISKLSNIKRVSGISITYVDSSGNLVSRPDESTSIYNYFLINYNITTFVKG